MIGVIAAHELRILFRSPLAWILAGSMQLVFAWLFLSTLELYLTVQPKLAVQDGSPGFTAFLLARFLAPTALTLLLISPLLSMRTLAEEQRSGALLLLRAAPVPLSTIVLGKFLGIFALQLLLLSLAFVMPLTLTLFTTPDLGSLFASFLGLALFGAACTAVSLYFSALTRQPMIAAFSAIAMLLVLWLIGSGSFSNESASFILQQLSLPWHLNSFLRGTLNTHDALYFLLCTALFLTLAALKLDHQRFAQSR
jgi:ABC-2 type transport system permease protein